MDTADAARLTEVVTGAVADAVKRGESYSSLENFLTDESVERMTEAVIEEAAKTQTGRRNPRQAGEIRNLWKSGRKLVYWRRRENRSPAGTAAAEHDLSGGRPLRRLRTVGESGVAALARELELL